MVMEEDPYMVGFILELFMGLYLSSKPRPQPVTCIFDLCGFLIIKDIHEVRFVKHLPDEQEDLDLQIPMVEEEED